MMYELEKSDSLVVPMKSANKTGLRVAESMEGSGGIARNAEHATHGPDSVPDKPCPSRMPAYVGPLRPHAIDSR